MLCADAVELQEAQMQEAESEDADKEEAEDGADDNSMHVDGNEDDTQMRLRRCATCKDMWLGQQHTPPAHA